MVNFISYSAVAVVVIIVLNVFIPQNAYEATIVHWISKR